MINRVLIVVALGLLLCCYGNDADAQSRRERKREEKRREAIRNYYKNNPQLQNKQGTKATDKTTAKPKPAAPKKEFDFPKTEMKDRYRIDVLAPLYLAELVQDGKTVNKGRLPDKVQNTLKFYEGMLIAADTLKKLGYKLDVFVYDVADELESPLTLVNTDAFAGSDLILGLLSSNDFPTVANYSRKHHVNFVSALSPSNQGISDNPYFTLLQPTLETHCNAVEEFLHRKHGNINPVMLYRSRVTVDSIAYAYFTSGNTFEYKPVLCDTIPSREQLMPLLHKDSKNVFVMPILSDKYAESILSNLYKWFPDYDFEVWGMPSWDNMASLKKADAYPNIVVYFTSPFYFDHTTASGRIVADAYKAKYGTRADNMVFRGYETMMWYAYLLKKYGNIFNTQLWDNGGAPFTRFNIKLVKDKDGQLMYNENKHLYLYRYHSSSYMVEQ